MTPDKIKEAINILQEAKQEINELFTNEPALTLRLNTVFNSLINGFNHTINQNLTSNHSEMKNEPLKSVFGAPITKDKPGKKEPALVPTAATKPNQNDESETKEVQAFREEINQIIPTLLDRQPDEIIEAVGELHLRGIAKTLGLDYEAPVNISFVTSIQDVLAKNKADEEIKAKNKEEALGESESDEPESIVVTQQHLDDNPELAENGIKVGDMIGVGFIDMPASEEKIYADGVTPEMVEKHIELYGKSPNKTWSAETIQKRIEKKNSEI